MSERCDHWNPGRCTAEGTHILYAPDGGRVPGGPICLAHGLAITTEYREKLDEVWTLRRECPSCWQPTDEIEGDCPSCREDKAVRGL